MRHHVIAVQLHSKIQDRLQRSILEIIALDIDDTDTSRISYRKIARLARLAVNTLQGHLDDILKSKELLVTPDGKFSIYRLNQELLPYDSVVTAHERSGIDDTNRTTRLNDLEEMESRLKNYYWQETGRLYQLCQQIVSIVSAPQSKSDTVSALLKDSNNININKDIYLFSSDDEVLSKYKTALSVASKTPWTIGFNEDKYDKAARWCIEQRHPISVIERFPAYWRELGWGGPAGKPTLDVVLAELENCANNVDTRRGGAKEKLVASGGVTTTGDSGGRYG